MWKRYLSPTPANVARLLIGAKVILMSIAGTVYVTASPKIACWVLLGTGILNEAANFLSNKPEENTTKDDAPQS